MSENNLFQFAQVIAELPLQTPSPNQREQNETVQNSYNNSRYLRIRKVNRKKKKKSRECYSPTVKLYM